MKKQLICFIILSICGSLFAQIPSNIPTNGLKGWWPFNGNVKDESGNGFNGTIISASLTNDRTNKPNSAYYFNGTSNKINLNTSLGITNLFNYTYSLWIYRETTCPIDAVVLSNYDGSFRGQLMMGKAQINRGVNFRLHKPSITTEVNTTIIDTNWTHFVVTKDSNFLKIYKNGIITQTLSIASFNPVNNTSTPLMIGAAGWSNSNFFKGKIDDIGIWNRALTPQEIKTIYNNCPKSITSQPTTLTTSNRYAKFKVIANDTLMTYQWQTRINGSWTNLNDNSKFSGTKNNELLIDKLLKSDNGTIYRCIVKGNCLNEFSDSVKLNYNCIANITTQPTNQNSTFNGVSFYCASNDTLVSYSWQFFNNNKWQYITDTGIYIGSQSKNLVIKNGNNELPKLKFRCIIKGDCTSDTSNQVKIICPKSITSQPTTLTTSNRIAKFKVIANDTLMTYQWQTLINGYWTNLNDNSKFSGTKNNELLIDNLLKNDNGSIYRCIVKGNCLNEFSDSVKLNYNCIANITTQPTDQNSANNGVSFYCASNDTLVSYTWQFLKNSNWHSITDTITFTGFNSKNLIVKTINYELTKTKFRCIVKGDCSTDTSNQVKINCTKTIIKQPTDYNAISRKAIFSILVNESQNNYKWQTYKNNNWENIKDTLNFSGSNTSQLNINNVLQNNNLQKFRCKITGGCIDTFSVEVTLFKQCDYKIINQPSNQGMYIGNAVFTCVANDTLLTYQWQSNLGMGWNNLSNAGQYSGTNSNTLTVNNVSSANNNQLFRCIIKGDCINDTTQEATLRVWGLGINGVNLPEFKLYPNPSSNAVTIAYSQNPYSIAVYNSLGQMVLSQSTLSNEHTFDISQWPKGVYYVELTDAATQTNKVQKLIRN